MAFATVAGWQPGPAHAIAAARVGKRAGRLACIHPGWGAFGCWLIWSLLTAPALVAAASAPIVRPPIEGTRVGETVYDMHRVAGTLWFLAWFFRMCGLTLAVAAVFLALENLFKPVTHKLGPGRQFQPVGLFGRPSMAQRHRNPGAFARVSAGKAGVVKDWKAAKHDAEDLNGRITRVGGWRYRRMQRRWARERAYGVQYSNPGRVDRWLFRHLDPPTERKAKKQAKRTAARAERKAGPADYPAPEAPQPINVTEAPSSNGHRDHREVGAYL